MERKEGTLRILNSGLRFTMLDGFEIAHFQLNCSQKLNLVSSFLGINNFLDKHLVSRLLISNAA